MKLNLNFSTQNVRSLDISTKNIITEQKILPVTKYGSDVIFLSDLRLNSYKQIEACKDLNKMFYLLGYKFIHNSTTSNRGVGILVKREFLEGFKIINTVRDSENNFILIDVDYNGIRFTAGSVYGANTNEGLPMYDSLQQKITDLGNKKVILGGDFNATFDNKSVEENIDVLNMANIPSLRRSNRILDMCAALDLTDPYRIIYPLTKEFTFTPHGAEQLNRSRLDFFLISKDFSANLVNVIIPHSLSSSTFDHKPVHLLFHKKGVNLPISSRIITFRGKNLKQGSMWRW